MRYSLSLLTLSSCFIPTTSGRTFSDRSTAAACAPITGFRLRAVRRRSGRRASWWQVDGCGDGMGLRVAGPDYRIKLFLHKSETGIGAAGTYTVQVGVCSGTNTGGYALFVQSTNNPSGAANLPLAQVQSGTIGSAALNNTYTINANANDIVNLRILTTDGNLNPRMRLYDATGALLNDVANTQSISRTSQLRPLRLQTWS